MSTRNVIKEQTFDSKVKGTMNTIRADYKGSSNTRGLKPTASHYDIKGSGNIGSDINRISNMSVPSFSSMRSNTSR